MMVHINQIRYTQDYARLPEEPLYRWINPQPLNNPELVVANDALATELGIDPESLYSETALNYFSGQALHPDWRPLAMKYTGHQFGHYNPDLGDGRGLLLADLLDHNGVRQDLHLKGAGLTPYSRFADGRAVLRSSIREYLCSEAMHALGVPTTRALALINSTSTVVREQIETGAMLVRVSPSHIRFGHFEYLYYTQQHETLRELADYTIERHHPDISMDSETRYAEWFTTVIERTAIMIAHWMSLGFVHGVMNTDNFSIIGETFDYGPYGFMGRYQPDFTPNHTDHSGRYAYSKQGHIAYWNLAALAQAIHPLMGEDTARTLLESFPSRFQAHYHHHLAHKCGLTDLLANDTDTLKHFMDQTHAMMAQNQFDMTAFYRDMTYLAQNERVDTWREQAYDLHSFDEWHKAYQTQLKRSTLADKARMAMMQSHNPAIVPRNHVIQTCILAAQSGDYAPLHQYLSALQSPYADGHDAEYTTPPPAELDGIPLSCSS